MTTVPCVRAFGTYMELIRKSDGTQRASSRRKMGIEFSLVSPSSYVSLSFLFLCFFFVKLKSLMNEIEMAPISENLLSTP